MTQRALLLVGLAGLFLPSGCAHLRAEKQDGSGAFKKFHTDFSVLLEVHGEVRDADQGIAVPYADVVFVDTGMKPDTHEAPWRTRAGCADGSGRIDLRYAYGW